MYSYMDICIKRTCRQKEHHLSAAVRIMKNLLIALAFALCVAQALTVPISDEKRIEVRCLRESHVYLLEGGSGK